MLKELIVSLNNEGVATNDLIADFSYLVKDSAIFTMYSIKLEVGKDEFKEWFFEHISHSFFDAIEELNEFINTIAYPWYEFYLNHKSLIDKTKSLKSDCKRWFKKNRDKHLANFDRFFEAIKRTFEEAYSVHDVVFYNASAIKRNKGFSDDRGSCYINSRKDYFTVIDQMDSYYIMVYRNGKPITRLWAVLSSGPMDNRAIVIFNSYGYQIKDLYKMFATKDEYRTIEDTLIEGTLGIHVNKGDWIISKDGHIVDFVYEIQCPSCGTLVYSDSLKLKDDKLVCESCNNGKVYSSYYEEYIPEDQAVYSGIYESYLYESDAVYSQCYDDYILHSDAVYSHYYNDYILRNDAVEVLVVDGFDWVFEKDTVYSSYYEDMIIAEHSVYSRYYDTNLLADHPDTVYSEWLDDYVDANDDDIICINGNDYVPKEDVAEYYILYNGIYYHKENLRYSNYYYRKWIYFYKKYPKYRSYYKKWKKIINKDRVITAW